MPIGEPGKYVTTLDKPAITFGDSDDVEEKYGGYAYQLDFNLALVEPMRMSVSFISENGEYEEDTLDRELEDLTNDNPTIIKYCGGTRTFQGYPLKYSINVSPQGNILTVEYYDTSIGELDNRIVVLNGRDVPLFEGDASIAEDSPIKYKYVDTNPCPEHILNIGREYVSTSTGIPQGANKCLDSDEVKEVLYTNEDLFNLLEKVDIPLDDDSKAILFSKEAERELFFENYHGTLREVLKQWGDRMGFTFYWDSDTSDDDDDDQRSGKLTFIELSAGLMFEDLKDTSKKMLEACNLLEYSKTVAKDNTFNKVISANYTSQGIGMAERTENFMLLDFFTCPLRGCVTSEGKDWPDPPYGIGVSDKDARYLWRASGADWYKEWDNPLYINTEDDTQDREWLEYQPLRPTESSGDSSTESEFRDLIRLIKAAAIGEDFFNAYMFFKAMKSSLDLSASLVGLTLEQYMAASGIPSIQAGIDSVYLSGLEINDVSKSVFTEDYLIDRKLDKWKDDVLEQEISGALAANKENGGFSVNNPRGGVLIPDLTENIIVTKILSDDPGNEDMPAPPLVNTPNISICRDTVLGKNCLTVKPLDPSFEATRNLYIEVSADVQGGGGCAATNRLIDADDAKFTNVWRTFSKAKWEKKEAVDENNGSPWIFSYTHKFGNSDVLNTGQNALYRQLRYIAENAGRFWVSPSVITRREFNNRNYNEDGIKFIPRDLDVLDSEFRDFFQEFDPMAGEAAQPFSKSDYDQFWAVTADDTADIFKKGGQSKEKQLNGWQGETKPDSEADIPCGRGDGKDFSPADSETAENTKAPNVQQMIERIIERTLPYSSDCEATGRTVDTEKAESTNIALTGAGDGLSKLKDTYRIGDGFTGGAGYSSLENNGDGPKIIAEFTDAGAAISATGSLSDLDISCEVITGVITQITVHNAGDVKLVRGEPDGGLGVKFVFEDPPSGDRGFFGDPVDLTSMENWDSITSTNLNLLNFQKQQSCCCTNDEKGVIILDKGSQLKVILPEDVKKSVERLSNFTNKPLESQVQSSLVRDYGFENKTISMSTNLIPKEELSGTGASNIDELDWIVDQVSIGVGGTEPTYSGSNYVIPTRLTEKVAPHSGSTCLLDPEALPYLLKNEKLELAALAMYTDAEEEGGPGENTVKTIPLARDKEGEIGKALEDCLGFTLIPAGVSARETQIEFVTPSDNDLKIDIAACGEDWGDLSSKEQSDKIIEIREKLAQYAKDRCIISDDSSYEARVVIADIVLQDKNGDPIKFDAPSPEQEGIPSIKQGLESLSIRTDANGLRVTITVSSRIKLQAIKKNFNLWQQYSPRLLAQGAGGNQP